jgi:hypothetical protein
MAGGTRPELNEKPAHHDGEFVQVSEIVLDGLVYLSVIDLQIEMDEEVPQAHPVPKAFGEIRREEALLAEHVHDVFISQRLPISLIGDDMLSDIQDAGAGELEITLGEMMDGTLTYEVLAIDASEGTQLNEIAIQGV